MEQEVEQAPLYAAEDAKTKAQEEVKKEDLRMKRQAAADATKAATDKAATAASI